MENKQVEEKPFLSDEEVKVLREGMLKDFVVNDQEMFIRICQKTRLDPFTKQIWIRPEKQGSTRGVIIAGIQGFLAVADRSGVYDGSDPILWCAKNGDWVDAWTLEQPPEAAKALVYRKDRSRPEVSVIRWNAVVSLRWDNDTKRKVPTDFWSRMPDYMLGKCALAAALRKAFPSLLTGVYETSEIPETHTAAASNGETLQAEPPPTGETLAADVAAQQARIEAEKAAAARLSDQGLQTVQNQSTPAAPRDAQKEVEPPDDLDMGQVDLQGGGAKPDPNWWQSYVIQDITVLKGKKVEELTRPQLIAIEEKWFPKVVVALEKTPEKVPPSMKRCYDALSAALVELRAMEARAAQKAAQKAAGGGQG